MRTRSAAVLVCACLWAVLGIAAFAGPAAAATIGVDHTLAQNDAPGEVDVETQFQVPSGTTTMEVTIPEETAVYDSEGFRQTGERTYEWTGSTNEPYLRYTMVGNETIDRGDGSEHLYVVTDEWAIVRSPSLNLQWTGVQSDVNVSVHTDGEGVAGRHITYLGPYDEHTRRTSDQRFRLVRAADADMREAPADVLDAFGYAAERLQIGQKDEEVLVFVVPTDGIEWAATGVQRGDSDMWVRDAETLADPKNTWIHEYVHTLQDYDRTEKTRWSIEGMADYYAALLTYERGDIDYETFRERMADGRDSDVSDVQLVDPSTWASNQGNYDKGGLVFGYLDRRLRTEHDSSIDAVVEQVNVPDQELTHQAFLDAVESAGGSDLRSAAARYTETTDAPPVWSRQEHVEAFGGPDFRYEFAGFDATGPYRNGSLESPRVVTGETLEVTVRVRNVGTREGEFTAPLLVDARTTDSETGRLAPDESTTLTLAHRFDTASEYELEVGAASTTAVVEAPAAPEVTDLAVDPAGAAMDERVTLRATVASSADRPAAGEVTFTADGESVATESVRIGDGTATVEATTSFDAPGEYEVRAGDRTATVSVSGETAVATATPRQGRSGTTPTLGDGSGFGSAVTLVALAASTLLLRRRR